MKGLKIAAYILGGIVGLLVVAVALIALLFDPNDYKADIARMVEEKTHRKLTLQGDLKLSFFPWLAVQMGSAQLSERNDTESFGSQPFVSLQSARLSVKLLPLFSGRVEIGNVELTAPNIRLITDAQGRHNWDDLAATNADGASPENETSSGKVSATIAGINIVNGEVVLDDRAKKTRTALQAFSLSASGIGSGEPFGLKTSFTLDHDGAQSQVDLAATVNADWDNKKYALSQLHTQIQWRSAASKESMPIELRADSMSVDMAQQTLQLSNLQLNVGAAKVTGNMAGIDIVDAPKFSGHVALAKLNPRDVFKQLHIAAPTTRDASAFTSASFESDVVVTPTSIALQKMSLRLDDTTAQGELGITDFAAKAIRFNLDVDTLNFDRYLPPPADATPSKAESAAPSAPTPIPVDLLRTLNARGELRVGQAQFSGLKLSKLKVGLAARDGDVQIAPAQAALYGGTYSGDIALNVASKIPRMALNSKVANVDFAPLLKDMLDKKQIAGRGNLNAKLSAVGGDTHALMQSLAGTLDFNIADGAYEGMDLWYEIRRARALLKQQPIPERVGAERTVFTAIKGSGVVHDGVMSNQDLDVSMQYLKVDGKGTVDLVKSTMDYKFNARVLRIPKETAEGAEMQELVDAEIPITAKGPLASPKVRPDLEGYLKARAKEEIKKETDKLKGKVQEKLQDKLQDLLRG